MLGLFILIITYFVDIGWRRKRGIVFANIAVIEKVTKRKIMQRSIVLFIIRAVALTFVIFALADLVVWYEGFGPNSDFIFAIDSSGSMLANDYAPSRLEAAKSTAIDIISNLDLSTQVGVISFAGTSIITQQLTNDRLALKNSIKEIDIIKTGGTAIGEVILLATNLLSSRSVIDDEKGKNLILITDGQSNIGLSVEDAVTYAKQNGVVINTIGIATEEGGSFAEASAVSQLDKGTLVNIAEETSGKFYHPQSKEELNSAIFQILNSQKRKFQFNAKTHLLIIAVFLLFIEWILVNTEYRITP